MVLRINMSTDPAKQLITPKPTVKWQRSAPRVYINKRAVLVMPRTGQPHPVLLHNLSRGGACVQTDARLSTGDDVRLLVYTGPQTKLTLDAIVVGIRQTKARLYTEYGLRFVNANKDAINALDAFVKQCFNERPGVKGAASS
jgi:Tfp pilus assembly protein PilZ